MPSPNWVEQLTTTWTCTEATLGPDPGWVKPMVTLMGWAEWFVGMQPGVGAFAMFGFPIPVVGGTNYLGSMTWTEMPID